MVNRSRGGSTESNLVAQQLGEISCLKTILKNNNAYKFSTYHFFFNFYIADHHIDLKSSGLATNFRDKNN